MLDFIDGLKKKPDGTAAAPAPAARAAKAERDSPSTPSARAAKAAPTLKLDEPARDLALPKSDAPNPHPARHKPPGIDGQV